MACICFSPSQLQALPCPPPRPAPPPPLQQDFKDQCEAYVTLYGPLVFNMALTYLEVRERVCVCVCACVSVCRWWW